MSNIYKHVLINRFRFIWTQVVHHNIQSLLVILYQLWLCWIVSTTYSRWKDIVYRLFIVVFFNTNSTYIHSTRARNVIQVLLIYTPISTHKVEISHANNDRFLEIGEEHTHKSNTCEIVYCANSTFKLTHWNTELIPSDMLFLSILELWRCFSLVYDEVSTHNHIRRTQRYAVLVILFILIQGVVLIDILNIWSRFV